MRVLLAAALLLLVGPASAQAVSAPLGPAPTTLHFHPVNWDDFPINTQPAQFGAQTSVASIGLLTTTLTCAPNPPMTSVLQEHHTWRGYSSPGYVEYDFMEDGHPRTAPEPQMGFNGSIAATPRPILHWFLETTDGVNAPPPAPDAPVPVPNVVVQATLRAASIGRGDPDQWDTGVILAQGRSAPALLAADQSQGVVHTMPDGHHVYEFMVPLDVEQAAIGAFGFDLRVDAFLDNPACAQPGHDAMPNFIEPFVDADHRPRIELTAGEPLRILSLQPRFVNGTVIVMASAQSLWGNYDIDEGNLTLDVTGPASNVSLRPDAVVQRTHEYNHHADPVLMDWALDRAALTPGLYWLNLTVANDQHTAFATAHAAFRIGPDMAYSAPQDGGTPDVGLPSNPVPAPGLAMLTAGLAFAALARKGSVNNR